AVITHPSLSVEQKDLWRSLSAELVRHAIAFIFEDRNGQRIFLGVHCDLGGSILAIGINGDELHAHFGVFRTELGKPRSVSIVDRALGAKEGNNYIFT